MENNFDAVILADGTFPTAAEPLEALKNASFLCCCDSAGKKLIECHDTIPDAIVGDGDSVTTSFREKYKNIYHQVTEQDYNDLTKATRFCIEYLSATLQNRAAERLRIAYIGATGKREDHTIGNIALMSFYHRQFAIDPIMITDYGTFTAHQGDATLDTFPRQQVSIFNVNCNTITSEGLKWDAYPYNELWQGTLNEALGNTITFHADNAYIVYRTHKPKN